MIPARGRIRNRRGEYQSIDHIGLEHIQQKSGRGNSHTADITHRIKKPDVHKAEDRLRIIE